MAESAVASFVVGVFTGLIASFVFRVFRCPHAWESVDKIEVPSRLDNIKAAGARMDLISTYDAKELSIRKIVLAIGCRKCGASKLIKEQSH